MRLPLAVLAFTCAGMITGTRVAATVAMVGSMVGTLNSCIRAAVYEVETLTAEVQKVAELLGCQLSVLDAAFLELSVHGELGDPESPLVWCFSVLVALFCVGGPCVLSCVVVFVVQLWKEFLKVANGTVPERRSTSGIR